MIEKMMDYGLMTENKNDLLLLLTNGKKMVPR